MDFSWSDRQIAFKNKVAQFAEQELSPNFQQRERDAVFPRDLWRKCAEFGILGLPFSQEYGGADEDIMTTTLAMEALGFACPDVGLTLGLNGQMWTVQLTLDQFGTADQKRRFLPGLCHGELIGAQAMTEPEAGSDVFSMKATAKRCDRGYLLNGHKCMITLAPVADLAVLFATIDPEKGRWGVTAFIVEKDTEGYRVGPTREKMGLRTLPMGDIFLENCLVPEENRLGPEGAGVSISNSSLEWERSCMLASQLGAMQRQLQQTVEYARKRRQFGQPIGQYQSVSNRIVDMKVRLETARNAIYQVAWNKQAGRQAVMEAAIAKLHLCECYVQSSLDAIRVHGGRGYLSEYGIEHDLRDAIGGVLYGGTSDIQRNIIARMLGL